MNRLITTTAVVFGSLMASTLSGAERVDYAREVAPLLARRCLRCHGPDKQEGGLRLDVRRRAFLGGDSGPVIVPGKAAQSALLKRVSLANEKRMPPTGSPLTDAQRRLLADWIDQGAAWPDQLAGKETTSAHWAFRPVASPTPPRVKHQYLVKSPIDAFILARLEDKGWQLAPAADKTTLLRRLKLDLLGLPPTSEEVQAFISDMRPDGYSRLVDRLLASPHFGERWGRHWLDVARFAESDGYENDNLRPNAWRFRDWVVKAINDDLPFDQFTIAQLAGDLVPQANVEHKIAAGFHRHTLYNSAASADKEEFRTYAVKDRTDTTGAAWLGLTLGCGKCHSHKYDPLTQREYYELYAFFNATDHQDVAVPGGQAMSLIDKKRPTHVHMRGNFQVRGPEVTPNTPAFLPPLAVRGKQADRLDLARWLVDPHHPLTARVAANAVWQHLFGAGLVATPENFGVNGQAPSHPELLDWLATELVRLKWSRKGLIRAIVHSAVYQQSSQFPADVKSPTGPVQADPDNRLLSRQNRFRVEAEIVRDLALAAAGLLDTKVGGPSIVPPFPEGFLAQRFGNEALKLPTKEHHRRGIYIHVQRTLTYPMLAAFDAADGNQSCLRRDRSITPMQALTMLNDPVFDECARALGKKVRQAASDQGGRLRWGFEHCLGRPARAAEMRILAGLVHTQQKLDASEEVIWIGVARTLLNLEEFITRE